MQWHFVVVIRRSHHEGPRGHHHHLGADVEILEPLALASPGLEPAVARSVAITMKDPCIDFDAALGAEVRRTLLGSGLLFGSPLLRGLELCDPNAGLIGE